MQARDQQQLTVRMTPELQAAVTERARRDGETVSTIMRQAIRHYLAIRTETA